MSRAKFIIFLCVIFSIYANSSNLQSSSSRQLLQSDESMEDISSTLDLGPTADIAMDLAMDEEVDDDDDDLMTSTLAGMDVEGDIDEVDMDDISSTPVMDIAMDIDDDEDEMDDISSTPVMEMDIAMDVDDDDDMDDISSTPMPMDIAMDIAAGPGPDSVLSQEEVNQVILVITDGNFAAFKSSVIEMSGLSLAESEQYDAQITAIIIESISESVDRAGGVLENLSVVEIIEAILEDVGDLIENQEIAQQPEAVTPAPTTPAPVKVHTPAPVKVTPAPVTPAPVTTKVINEGSLGKEGAEGDEQGHDLDRFMRENGLEEEEEEGEGAEVETETVTLKLSEKTMVNIWIALVVFMCFNGSMIWCYFKRNRRGSAILFETGTSDERPSSMPLP